MRRVVVSLSVAVLMCATWAAAARVAGAAQTNAAQVTPPRMTQGQQNATGTAVLKGTVVAADTGAPIRRAQVRAVAPEAQDTRLALTDDQGRFELRDLVGGKYIVSASRAGFVTLQYGQRRPNERGTPVDLAAGQTLDKLSLALPRGGVIAGRVMDELGEPLAEAQVQVMRSVSGPGGRQLVPVGRGGATSDDQGAFRIYGLPPGDYFVSATLRSQSGMEGMAMGSRAAPEGEQGYAATFYPGTPSLNDAQRVTVGAGQEVSGIAFGLTPTRLAFISGRIVGTDPSRIGFLRLIQDDFKSGPRGAPFGAPVQPDATFVINGVPPGRYTLQTQPRRTDGTDGADDLVGSLEVTVAGLDLAGLVVPMRRLGVVRGVIEFEGGVPQGIPAAQVRVMPMPADPGTSRMFMAGPPPETNADFTFAMRGIMAPILLRASAPQGWYLHSIVRNGEDVTDVPLPAGPGVDLQDVRVRLTQTVASVSGTVRDDRGQIVLDASVIIFPTDDVKLVPGSRYLRSARPDTQGRFEVRPLPAYGNYRIIALQGVEDGQIYDPEFIAGIRDRAERLAIAAGESKTLDLRLRQ